MSSGGQSNPSRNSDETRAAIDRLDRGNETSPAQRVGYDAGDGQSTEWPGDTDAPFVKSPPFTEEPVAWLPTTPLPADGTYVTTPEVDVEDWRLLQVLIELFWENANAVNTSQLSLVAEHLASSVMAPPEQWYVTGVVDPAVTVVALPGFGDGIGSRSFAPSELRTELMSVPGFFRTVRLCLQFDVANAKAFRLNLAQLIDTQTTSAVALSYQRSN
jgi:hypothetical protein